MSTDAPAAPKTPDSPPSRPAATPRSTASASGSGSGSKQTKRAYVVLEEKADGTIVRAGETEAMTPDDANWQLVEEVGSDLNTRAKDEDAKKHPKLAAFAKSGFKFEAYKLRVETVVKRDK